MPKFPGQKSKVQYPKHSHQYELEPDNHEKHLRTPCCKEMTGTRILLEHWKLQCGHDLKISGLEGLHHQQELSKHHDIQRRDAARSSPSIGKNPTFEPLAYQHRVHRKRQEATVVEKMWQCRTVTVQERLEPQYDSNEGANSVCRKPPHLCQHELWETQTNQKEIGNWQKAASNS